MVTRRHFLRLAAGPSVHTGVPQRLRVPIHRVTDIRTQAIPQHLHRFWSEIWPEAYQNFNAGGIELETSDGSGEVRRSAGDNPIFMGLRRSVINLVLTDHLPLYWDGSRALAGGSRLWEGYVVCVIGLRYAHPNQMPFLSVNTCVHELLHALLEDVFVRRPSWYQSGGREERIDWYATRLWLFHDGRTVREKARACLRRLAGGPASQSESLGYVQSQDRAEVFEPNRMSTIWRRPSGDTR